MYPALAVAERLLESEPQTTLAFVGTVGGFEKPLVEKSGVRLDAVDEVHAAPFHGISPLKAAAGLLQTLRGTWEAWRVVGKRQPDAVLMTGGWVGLPVAVAAWLRRVPVVIFLPDIEPALSIKILRRFAAKIAVTTDGSAPYVPAHKMVVTGYPLRRAMMQATRADAIAHFRLDPNKKTLLVFGGSRGARTINIAVIDALPELLGRGDVQIIHVTGELDAERGAAVQADGYHHYAYLHDDMGLAMAAADLCICRSGASTLGELPYFSLPSILVPYPFAWRYQKVNADYLAGRSAGVVLPDESMETQLAVTVRDLLDHPEKLAAMRDAAHTLSRPDAAEKIGDVLREVIG